MDKQSHDPWRQTSRTRRQGLAAATRAAVGAGALSALGLASAQATSSRDERGRDALTLPRPESQHPTHADFYVAPGGADTNPGTAAAPFATLARARDAVRQKISAGHHADLLVLVRGGTYRQSRPLQFDRRDAHGGSFSVTYAAYPGEQVILSGGQTIRGWKRAGAHLWTAHLPGVRSGHWYFRQLFVNGRRATRARMPNPDDATPAWTIVAATPAGQGRDTTFTVSLDQPIKAWKNASDIELVWLYDNDGSRKRVGMIDVAQQSLTLPPPAQWVPANLPDFYQIGLPAAGRTCYLENALEFLDRPGEWYLDRSTGTLYYYPLPGEDMASSEVIAPVVQNTLLEIVGTAEQPIRNLHFRGIEVQHVDWPLPAEGYVGLFGCIQITVQDTPASALRWWWIDAAVTFRHARDCSFTDGAVAHGGGIGLALRQGCATITVEGNRIFDLGGGGIVVGLIRNRDTLRFAEPVTLGDQSGYRIANNYIHHCGAVYAGSIGIFVALTQNSVIGHNEIHDVAYAGINAGGNEDAHLPFAMNNVYAFNHIHHVMQVAVDGAGIYVSTGFVPLAGRTGLIQGNWIHDLTGNPLNPRTRDDPGPFISPGLYLDGVNTRIGCKGWEFVGNVVYRTGLRYSQAPPQFTPLYLNYCTAAQQRWAHNVLLQAELPAPGVLAGITASAGLEERYRHLLQA